jgi:hypothetical protein
MVRRHRRRRTLAPDPHARQLAITVAEMAGQQHGADDLFPAMGLRYGYG